MARTKQLARMVVSTGSATKPMNTGSMHVSPYIQKSRPLKTKKRKGEAAKGEHAVPTEGEMDDEHNQHDTESDEDDDDDKDDEDGGDHKDDKDLQCEERSMPAGEGTKCEDQAVADKDVAD